MPDSSGAFDLNSLSREEQDAVQKLAEEREEQSQPRNGPGNRMEVQTAFIVLVPADGNPQVAGLHDPGIHVQVPPNNDLVYAACSVILKDIQAHESAQSVAAIMGQQAQALMQQQQDAMIRAKLAAEGGGLRG